MKYNNSSILFFIILIVAIMGPTLSSFQPELKYLKYSSLILILPILFSKSIKRSQHNFIIPFLLLIAFTIIRIDAWTFNSITYILIWISAMVPFMSVAKLKVNLKALNVIYFFGPTLYFITNRVSLDFSLSAFFTSSTSSLESSFSMFTFIYALFFVYWMVKRNKTMAVLNLIFILITFKRIAFIVIPIVIIMSFFNFDKIKSRKIQFLMIISNVGYLFFTYQLGSGQFDSLIENYTGLSAGHFTMGRTSLNEIIIEIINNSSWYEHIFGHGMGSTTTVLFENYTDLLHNDILKIYYEGGGLLFFLFFYFFYNHLSKNQILLTITLNIFFLTDNTLIYSPVLLIYFTLMYHVSLSKPIKIKKIKMEENVLSQNHNSVLFDRGMKGM